ncbi:DUF5685 family protein [Haloferula helveola]|uniref:DUF5685 family protein n=1 Tax=Haloferula helveola TaxID=490095 RepID=UPI0030965384
MFGFIASPCARCTESSFPAWRGSFCGLARCLGREFGNPSRLLVNRDATFLALVGVSLDPSPPRWRRETCCNPLAMPFPVTDDHPAVMHAAAVSVCGLATKLADDSRDEGPVRRTASRIGATLVEPATDRAVQWLNSSSFPTQRVIELLNRQEDLEARDPIHADRPTSEAFGTITGHLAEVLPLPGQGPVLHQLGSALGSLVYWRDAWDDRETDRRKGRFNPFHRVAEPAIGERIQAAWSGFTDALSKLPFVRHRELFDSLCLTTAERHGSFLELKSEEKLERRRKRRRDREQSRCCDSCDCCPCECCNCCPSCGSGTARSAAGSKGCLDACFDCGPGDSGCCDCCPCDGCDCCPCN